MTSPRPRRLLASVAALTLLGLGAIACSAGTSTDDSSGSDAAGASAAMEDAPAAASDALAVRPSAEDDTADPALIRTGDVALRADDVAEARFRVQQVVDRYAGEVAERTTEAGDDGREARARMVLRVPTGDFHAALDDLEEVGDKVSSSSSDEDVTTQVIDTDVRVRLQRRSIARISVLLDRATSIRDIVSIEGELARREADLGSLEKRRAYLADQTSLGTITVSIELPPTEEEARDDDEGFVAGLSGGWDAFRAATVNLLTGLGAVLPFAVLLLLLAVPARFVVRRVSRSPRVGQSG